MTVGDGISDPLSISLNGADNIGKTTQLRWLERGIPGAHLVGSVDAWHPGWVAVAGPGFARWWFVESTTEEHVALVMAGHRARREASGSLALEDRGAAMLRATCAATAAIKENLSPEAALQRVADLTGATPACSTRAEFHVLLRRSADPAEEATEALRRERVPVNARYRAYQEALAAAIAYQVSCDEYDVVLDIGGLPILDVQTQLRSVIAARQVPVDSLPGGPERLWVLGGLSESGKSTVGELLRDEHGVTRLKIGYLLEVAVLRAGVADPYRAWTEIEQAERLTEELLRFAATTKASHISIESAHRFEATEHLRRVWGERCSILLVTADFETRARRATESTASMRERDRIKVARGADRIIEIADHHIDNSGPRSALTAWVTHLFGTSLPHAAPVAAPPASAAPRTCRDWLTLATAHLVDPDVALVLSTGSTGTTLWREGWSDLDVLVVRDRLPTAWLRGHRQRPTRDEDRYQRVHHRRRLVTTGTTARRRGLAPRRERNRRAAPPT